MSKPKLLDLFCGQGGASEGYRRAGFDVVGVDIEDQPYYPFEFHKEDALKFALENYQQFDAIHASPPCQAHSHSRYVRKNDHPDFIVATRNLLKLIGKPWVIENVKGAPLDNPIELCGCMFGLRTYRERLFEFSTMEILDTKNSAMDSMDYKFSTLIIPQPKHQPHTAKITKMGRKPVDGEFMHIVGNFIGAQEARDAMDAQWMTRDGLAQAIPPAYTKYIGRYLKRAVNG